MSATADLTYYDLLGVAEDASTEDIKSAYRRLVKLYHPDLLAPSLKGSPEAVRREERFKEIAEAYEVLSDAGNRASYDQALAEFRSQATASATPPPQPSTPQPPQAQTTASAPGPPQSPSNVGPFSSGVGGPQSPSSSSHHVVGTVAIILCGLYGFAYLFALVVGLFRAAPTPPRQAERRVITHAPVAPPAAQTPHEASPEYSLREITPIVWSNVKNKFAAPSFGSSPTNPSLQFWDGLVAGGWINWRGEYSLQLDQLTLNVSNLKAFPMGDDGTTLRDYAVGYVVTLADATFEDGSMTKCFLVEHSFLGDAPPPRSLSVAVRPVRPGMEVPYNLTGVWEGSYEMGQGAGERHSVILRLIQKGNKIDAESIEAAGEDDDIKGRFEIGGWALSDKVTLLHKRMGSSGAYYSAWVLDPRQGGTTLLGKWFNGFASGEIRLRKTGVLTGAVDDFAGYLVPKLDGSTDMVGAESSVAGTQTETASPQTAKQPLEATASASGTIFAVAPVTPPDLPAAHPNIVRVPQANPRRPPPSTVEPIPRPFAAPRPPSPFMTPPAGPFSPPAPPAGPRGWYPPRRSVPPPPVVGPRMPYAPPGYVPPRPRYRFQPPLISPRITPRYPYPARPIFPFRRPPAPTPHAPYRR